MAIANKIEFHFRANSDKKIARFSNKLKNPTFSLFYLFLFFFFFFIFIYFIRGEGGGGGFFLKEV